VIDHARATAPGVGGAGHASEIDALDVEVDGGEFVPSQLLIANAISATRSNQRLMKTSAR
jgi:hypothetical protein